MGARFATPVVPNHERAAAQRKRNRVGLSGGDVLVESAYAVPR